MMHVSMCIHMSTCKTLKMGLHTEQTFITALMFIAIAYGILLLLFYTMCKYFLKILFIYF